MRILFSEARAEYANYIFSYAVWGKPEPGETPADCFALGFLPGSQRMDRYYLCRHLRVDLQKFELNSENRRILRKGAGVSWSLMERKDFDWNEGRRAFCQNYADNRFGGGVMPPERLESVFTGAVATHAAVFHETGSGRELGIALLHIEPGRMAYYYYAFYDLSYLNTNLGMHMMTCLTAHCWEAGLPHIYLGSCYSDRALYKTQFRGIEFFNGMEWSPDIEELKFLLSRDLNQPSTHLLEDAGYLARFHESSLADHFQKSKTRSTGGGQAGS